MQQEQPFDERQSFMIIQQMINTAKEEQKDDGKSWIIWGWMLFIASIATIINMEFGTWKTFIFWDAFGIFTILFTIYQFWASARGNKRVRVKTFTQEIFRKLNAGFFISLVFIIIAMNIGINPKIGFPLLMDLYGFWILIYGTVLNFKPSMIGAFAMWFLAFVALFFAKSFQVTMALHAAGVLVGYIIPGHIANTEFKKVAARNLSNQKSSV